MKFTPIVVSSMHGFKSHGKWQKPFADFCSTQNIPTNSSFGYGYRLLGALIPGFKRKLIKEFYIKYSDLINNKHYKINNKDSRLRPSIVAHSLGSYIVCNSMLKYPDIKFDKILLCGSIVNKNFDWDLLFRRNQVHFVRNEFSSKDKVVNWAWLLSLSNSGKTGKNGFFHNSNFFQEQEFEYFDHGSYFEGNHMFEYWLPFFKLDPPTFHIIRGNKIDSIKTFKNYFQQTDKIDFECYGKEQFWKDFYIQDDLVDEWIKINPDIYSFLALSGNQNSIIGYINAMPIKDEAFKKLLDGKLIDNQIKPTDVISYEENNDKVNMYIMSIALNLEFQNTHLGLKDMGFELLFNSLIDKLIEYYKTNKVKVKKIAAVGWTEKGQKLCELFGMVKTGVNEEKTNKPIYLLELEVNSIEKIHKSIRKLLDLYKG